MASGVWIQRMARSSALMPRRRCVSGDKLRISGIFIESVIYNRSRNILGAQVFHFDVFIITCAIEFELLEFKKNIYYFDYSSITI